MGDVLGRGLGGTESDGGRVGEAGWGWDWVGLEMGPVWRVEMEGRRDWGIMVVGYLYEKI